MFESFAASPYILNARVLVHGSVGPEILDGELPNPSDSDDNGATVDGVRCEYRGVALDSVLLYPETEQRHVLIKALVLASISSSRFAYRSKGPEGF